MDLGLQGAGAARPNTRRRLRPTTIFRLQLALSSAIVAIALTGTAHAEEKDAVPKPALLAKIHYCETCHGPSGRGFRGYYPMPRLAGQPIKYLENQLQAFIERRRTNNIMFNVAHDLSSAMVTALATTFHDFDPKPLGGAPPDLVAAGKTIYEEGISSADVPPCASCHGPEAKGDGDFPRLAGQLHDYVLKKLMNWSKERGQDPTKPDASAIMEPIAHGLTEPQIKAVAAYVNYLE